MSEESQEKKPLGKSQTLRREVRFYMAHHVMKNQGSFVSYMSTSAVMWLLGGREGVSPEDRVRLVEHAHRYIAMLHQAVGDDPDVTMAHASCDQLLNLTRARVIESGENEPKPGDLPVEEFINWMSQEFTEDPKD